MTRKEQIILIGETLQKLLRQKLFADEVFTPKLTEDDYWKLHHLILDLYNERD